MTAELTGASSLCSTMVRATNRGGKRGVCPGPHCEGHYKCVASGAGLKKTLGSPDDGWVITECTNILPVRIVFALATNIFHTSPLSCGPTGDSVTLGVKDDRHPTGNLLPPLARRDHWTAQLRERPLLLVSQQDGGVPVDR